MAEVTADANLAEYGRELADALEAAIPRWIERAIVARVRIHRDAVDVDEDVAARARAAGSAARDAVMPPLRDLLAKDVDEQRENPLAVVRGAVVHATEALRALAVPAVERDEFEVRAFPEDVYGVSPATFADIDASVQEPGILWGAAKAHAHLSRHRS